MLGVPELDFFLIGDFVRIENQKLDVMGGSLDTIFAISVPAVHAAGIAIRIRCQQSEGAKRITLSST